MCNYATIINTEKNHIDIYTATQSKLLYLILHRERERKRERVARRKSIFLSVNSRAVTALQGNAANPMNYRRCPPISCINANAGCYRIVEQGQIERARGGRVCSHLPTVLHAVILQPRNGLLMHYSSANAASAARMLPRCCALTCPKLRQHSVRETSEKRSLNDAHRSERSLEG